MFDNTYYKTLLAAPWAKPGADEMAQMIGLPSDHGLGADPECRPYIEKYAADQVRNATVVNQVVAPCCSDSDAVPFLLLSVRCRPELSFKCVSAFFPFRRRTGSSRTLRPPTCAWRGRGCSGGGRPRGRSSSARRSRKWARSGQNWERPGRGAQTRSVSIGLSCSTMLTGRYCSTDNV